MGALNQGVYNFNQESAQDVDPTDLSENASDTSSNVSRTSGNGIEVASGDLPQEDIDYSGYEADLSSNTDTDQSVSLLILSLY